MGLEEARLDLLLDGQDQFLMVYKVLFQMDFMNKRLVILSLQEQLMNHIMNYSINLRCTKLSFFKLFCTFYVEEPEFVDESFHGSSIVFHGFLSTEYFSFI